MAIIGVRNGLNIVDNINEMVIGDMIPCRYIAASGVAGTFTELGTCTATEIPAASSATPNGLFYFIKVDKGLLIADRGIQHSISWDTLNAGKYIEGSDNTTTTIPAGTNPCAIWGDSINVYVANINSKNVTCIKRSDNTTTTIPAGTTPCAIWGDSINVYVANYSSNNVTCIKRSDNTTTTIPAGTTPYAIWGDSINVYVANYGSNNVTYIKRSDNITLIRSLSGGNSYIDSNGLPVLVNQNLGAWPLNNEWDMYVGKSTLGGKITPGADNIWNWSSNMCTWAQNTPVPALDTTAKRIIRGASAGYGDVKYFYPQPSTSTVGNVVFRPVLEYIERGSKQTNLYY